MTETTTFGLENLTDRQLFALICKVDPNFCSGFFSGGAEKLSLDKSIMVEILTDDDRFQDFDRLLQKYGLSSIDRWAISKIVNFISELFTQFVVTLKENGAIYTES